jgi:hypothetical protein
VYHGRKKLAASFVVTVAVMPGCRKTSGAEDSAYVFVNADGRCALSVSVHCPKGASCNPPEPPAVDCPPDKRDAAAPAPPTRRPPGKEDWLRVKPRAYAWQGHCSYSPEYFCAPPGKKHQCTQQPPATTKIPCTELGDGGTFPHRFGAFGYQDGIGQCHEVDGFECPAGGCDLPEGRIVPC